MIKSENLLDKELVKSLVYSNRNEVREWCTETVINGRKYLKYGTLQVVTIIGNIFKVANEETGRDEYWLFAGMAKQHPTDIVNDKNLATELAANRAYTDPFMIMQVGKNFGEISFRDMMRTYVSDLDLEFVKTKEEIEKNILLY